MRHCRWASGGCPLRCELLYLNIELVLGHVSSRYRLIRRHPGLVTVRLGQMREARALTLRLPLLSLLLPALTHPLRLERANGRALAWH